MAGLLFVVELCLVSIAVAAAYVAPGLGSRGFALAGSWLARLAKRPGRAVLIVGLTAVVARLAVLPINPIPYPVIHDEFSYLLIADTFLHGRLANPPHPLWPHFESIHIIQQPTYASMYYPAQGALLAAGELIFGHPFAGVLLSVGLMCGAICWMLQAWVPPRWALAGGFLAIVRLAVFSYWSSSYFGGALAALGGALALGALPRLKRRLEMGTALLMAVGLILIANTRPFEGLFFALPIAVSLGFWLFGAAGPRFGATLRRLVIPVGLSLVMAILLMCFYFWRVTGSPFQIPYQIAMKTYGLLYFPWQDATNLPPIRHAELAQFYRNFSLGQYQDALAHPFIKIFLSFGLPWLFFFGPLLTLPLLAGMGAISRGQVCRSLGKKTRFLIYLSLFSSIALILPIYFPMPHYAAACTGAFYALVIQGMRLARRWRFSGKAAGITLVTAVPVIAVLLLLFRGVGPLLGLPLHAESPRMDFVRTWSSPQPDLPARERIANFLRSLPEPQLAIVRYEADHDPILSEWVYNEADIDNSKVVWAREMGPAEDHALLSYFNTRRVWLVEPDQKPPRLSPYFDDERSRDNPEAPVN